MTDELKVHVCVLCMNYSHKTSVCPNCEATLWVLGWESPRILPRDTFPESPFNN